VSVIVVSGASRGARARAVQRETTATVAMPSTVMTTDAAT
jgi:hypothetical protein